MVACTTQPTMQHMKYKKKIQTCKIRYEKDMNIREKIQILKYKISDINAISVEQNKTVFAAGGGASVAFEV